MLAGEPGRRSGNTVGTRWEQSGNTQSLPLTSTGPLPALSPAPFLACMPLQAARRLPPPRLPPAARRPHTVWPLQCDSESVEFGGRCDQASGLVLVPTSRSSPVTTLYMWRNNSRSASASGLKAWTFANAERNPLVA